MASLINVVCVCTGEAYGPEYLRRMRVLLDRHLDLPKVYYVISDQPHEGWAQIHPLVVTRSWWDKLHLFGPHMPAGRLLYMDLDQIVLGDITDIVSEAIAHSFSCFGDPINWHGERFGSSFLSFETGQPWAAGIYNEWLQHVDDLRDAPGGDQVWLAQSGLLPPVHYLEEDFPGVMASYKFDLKGQPPGAEVRIVNCHGKPKPDDLRDYWALSAWHAI